MGYLEINRPSELWSGRLFASTLRGTANFWLYDRGTWQRSLFSVRTHTAPAMEQVDRNRILVVTTTNRRAMRTIPSPVFSMQINIELLNVEDIVESSILTRSRR